MPNYKPKKPVNLTHKKCGAIITTNSGTTRCRHTAKKNDRCRAHMFVGKPPKTKHPKRSKPERSKSEKTPAMYKKTSTED